MIGLKYASNIFLPVLALATIGQLRERERGMDMNMNMNMNIYIVVYSISDMLAASRAYINSGCHLSGRVLFEGGFK